VTDQTDIEQLKTQQALTVRAIAAFLAGQLDGPASAKAYLLAIDPNLEVTPAAFEFGPE
jgi:hypothetical protein